MHICPNCSSTRTVRINERDVCQACDFNAPQFDDYFAWLFTREPGIPNINDFDDGEITNSDDIMD